MSNYFLMFLQNRCNYLEKLISEKTEMLRQAPNGKIRISGHNGYTSFYLITEKGKPRGKYLKKANMETIQRLVQKDYDERILEAANLEIKPLKKLIKAQEFAVEDIYSRLSLPRQQLITPIKLSDEEYVRQWLAREYEPMGFNEDDPFIESLNGLRVRSKSERLWADSMDKLGVPFLFEPPLFLEGHGWVRPDFEALNVRLRKSIFIENLGMMDDAEYAEDNIQKIHDYETNGLLVGDELLITMETRRHPISPKTIEEMIKKYLL